MSQQTLERPKVKYPKPILSIMRSLKNMTCIPRCIFYIKMKNKTILTSNFKYCNLKSISKQRPIWNHGKFLKTLTFFKIDYTARGRDNDKEYISSIHQLSMSLNCQNQGLKLMTYNFCLTFQLQMLNWTSKYIEEPSPSHRKMTSSYSQRNK